MLLDFEYTQCCYLTAVLLHHEDLSLGLCFLVLDEYDIRNICV